MKIKKIVVLAAVLTIFGLNSAKSQGLGDLLGGGLGNTIGNMLEGVFSSSNITIADMAGEWTANGPAVCFQGEGFLKKAGGVAAAAAIETKLAPYYEQYGLNNASLVIDNQGNFSLTCKMTKLSGTITRNEKAEPGIFEFNFTALGMKLATVTTYVQMTSRSMDVMFDATKLKKLLSAVGQFSGIQIVKTLTNILDSYEGLCVGFHMSGTRAQNQNGANGTGNGNGFSLGNILGGFGIGSGNDNNGNNGAVNKGNTNSNGTTNKDNTNKGNSNSNANSNNSNNNSSNNGNSYDPLSTGLDLLRGILGGGRR